MRRGDDDVPALLGSTVESSQKRPLALFLHGYATSPTDLCMLADAFAQAGFEIRKPWLAGHPVRSCDTESEKEITMPELQQSVLIALSEIDFQQFDVYLVGFSLGGALAIDAAADFPLTGVLAINPFFEPTNPRLAHSLLKVATFFPWIPLKRQFQTTLRQSRKYLAHEVTSLPLQATREIIEKSPDLGVRLALSKCPIIIVHSLNDKVAAFSASARVVRRAARSDIRLVPIHGLNHFMQFDVSPQVLRDLALTHFETRNIKEAIDPKLLATIHSEHHQESRHWSGIVFQIIVGFFSLFGALLAFSLPEVLSASWGEAVGQAAMRKLPIELQVKHLMAVAGAPYYLVAYAFIIYLYLILLSLYFFYLNRIDTFIRIHVEPLHDVAPWIQSRTRSEATGRTSRRMTNMLSVPIVMIPWVVATVLVFIIPFIFSDRLFVWEVRNVFLHAFYFVSVVMAICAACSLLALQHHTSHVAYGVPAPITTTLAMEKQISRLYASVCRGAYARHAIMQEEGDEAALGAREMGAWNEKSTLPFPF